MPPGDVEPHWPPFTIRIRVGSVTLRPVREVDLADLLDLLPDDVEHDPASELFGGLDLEGNRWRIFLQTYWRSAGAWSPNGWWLPFLVTHQDRAVGVQTLEGEHFSELRVVDSSSWLTPAARGKGVGLSMRAGILALAFDHLEAETAVSSAREDNAASIGVSRRLGYVNNGISRSRSPSGPCTLRHMVLTRNAWKTSGRGRLIEVSGLEGCGPWFGFDL
jgi:RimJ/RimL family protein N-acetyltransferase